MLSAQALVVPVVEVPRQEFNEGQMARLNGGTHYPLLLIAGTEQDDRVNPLLRASLAGNSRAFAKLSGSNDAVSEERTAERRR